MMRRVLDLGCGRGQPLWSFRVTAENPLIGVDIDADALMMAKARFPMRAYVQASGEHLPFADESFGRVIGCVALPYMDIPTVLSEIRRVLIPGGALTVTLHLPYFTMRELRNAFPHLIPFLYRLYVLANGCYFYLTGKTVRFFNRRTESFQSERGMRLALNRAGFDSLSFRRGIGRVGE